MKRNWLLPALLFLCVTQLAAQTPQSSLLWKISGKGLQTPSYIFGTMHIMCKGDFTVSDTLENKIRSSKQFYGEIDLDQSNLRADMMAKLVMQGQTMESLLGEDYARVSEKFKDITGTPMIMLNNFKPFFALSLLAYNCVPCTSFTQPETEFMAVAKKYNLSIHGLETIDDQLNAIDKEPLDSQVSELKKMILNFDSVKNGLLQFMEVYKRRNIDSLYSFMMNTGITEDFTTNLIDNRNQKWIPLIQKAIAEKPSFIAVGAGHLGGPQGVISLLRKQGYRVTPVKF